ncbi:MAG: hypothetical protein ACI815_001845 [Psychroserpens sp.]|jgi:hypothetical protein
MKKFISYLMYTGLLVFAMNFTSCQDEFEELPTGNEQEAIAASSSTANLVERTSSNDGSFDNIVDGSSCIAIQFPYTVEVAGIQLTIDSIADLRLIEEIFDAIDGDEDFLEILFPITITLSDFTEVVINNKEDLREIAADCKEGGDDDDIECIDFVYPVKLYTFSANLQQTGSVVVNNDLELRRFFKGLDDNDLVSFDFPVSLALYDGTEITVNSNAELANAIENAKDACDEDDDNDYNDDDFNKERLDKFLVACPFLVHEVKRDGINQTDQYFEYVMNFKENGTVIVRNRIGAALEGTWSTRVGENRVLLKLEFDVLVDFTLEWFVYEIEEGKIKLYSGEGNKIIMKKACDIVNNTPDTLREILKECSWVIKKVKNNNEEIDRLLGYKFSFGANAEVTLSNGVNTSTGSWAITTNAQGQLVMAITMGDEPGVSFEWLLRDLDNKRLKFEIEGTAYELLLERHCNDNNEDGDVMEIRNYLMGGAWKIANYTIDEGENTFAQYADFDFFFSSNNVASISVNADPLVDNGLWRIIRDSEGKLKCYLNYGEGNNFITLSDDWDIVAVTSTRLELRSESGDGTIETLVFEK